MLAEQIEKLRRQYTDQYVVVAGEQPELARFRGLVGQVKTVNWSGRALVQFDANNDRAWYDIAVERLKIVDKPAAKPVEKKAAPPVKAKAAAEKPAEKP
jgi:hypothetical protein